VRRDASPAEFIKLAWAMTDDTVSAY